MTLPPGHPQAPGLGLAREGRGVLRPLEERWIRPRVVGEFEDGALLGEFGTAGHGIFVTPKMVEKPMLRAHRLRTVGRTEAVRARVYAISAERRLKHPAVAAICDTARSGLGVRKPAASASRP